MFLENIINKNLLLGVRIKDLHKVTRLILTLSGEVILNAEPHIGLLHRGTEKIIEYKTINQGLPYVDRIDYVSIFSNEDTYAMNIEVLTFFLNSLHEIISSSWQNNR